MKQYEALYIDGKLVNIGNSDITLEWKSVMLSNISKLKTNHSYTIKLPMTVNNRKVFEMVESAPHDAYAFAHGVKTPIGKRMSARYYCNGIDLLGNANAYLIGTEKEYYKVVLTWGSLSMMQNVIDEDKTLPEIFGDANTPPTTIYWERWPGTKISDSLGENVVCLVYDNGVVGDEMMGYTYYMPSFKVTWIIDKIFRKYGVKYDFSKTYKKLDGTEETVTEKLLDSLYIPMTTWNDSPYVQNNCRNTWYLNHAEQNDEHTFLYGDYPAFMQRVYWIIPEGKTAPVYGWCGVFQKMKYKIHTHVRVFIDRMDSGMTEAEVVNNVKLCIVNGNSTDSASKLLNLTATSIKKQPDSLVDWGNGFYEVRYEYLDEWEEVSDNDTPGDDSWKGTHTGSHWDDVVIMRQGRRVWIDGYGKAKLGTEQDFIKKIESLRAAGYTIDIESYDNWVEIIPVITTPMPWHELGQLYNGEEKSPLYLEPNFPDVKPIDFLKGIFYLIGAYPVVINETLKISLYRDIVENVKVAKDWSKFIMTDEEMPSQIDFEMTDWAKRNWLWFKNDNKDDPQFSNFFEIVDDYLSDENDVFTLPFEGCKTKKGYASVPIYEPGKVLNYYKTSSQWAYADEIDGYVLKECKPRICVRYYLTKGLEDILGSDPLWNLTIGASQTTNLTWLNLLRDSLVFEPLSFANKGGETWARYAVFAEMLRHPYVLTVSMDIDEYTLNGLDLSIPVFLRQYGSYFGIMSIKRKSDGLCTVKLLRIPNTLITSV